MNGANGTDSGLSQPPPDRGARLDWPDMPVRVRRQVERWLGSAVTSAVTQPTGFSPGVAARLTTDNGRRVFAKAVGPEPNADAPSIHRREISIVAALPTSVPMPRLLWSYDEGDGGWVVLVFEDINGRHPEQPWQSGELDRVVAAMEELTTLLNPSPLSDSVVGTARDTFDSDIRGWRRLRDQRPSQLGLLDSWSRRHLETLVDIEETAAEAVVGDALLNLDIRADNILLTPQRTWFVDWPHARVGAAWLDVVTFAPSVTMQGGPPPEQVIARHAACRTADSEAITAAVVAIAGYFTHQSVQSPPPGLPTLRAFQHGQGAVAREWISTRTGLS